MKLITKLSLPLLLASLAFAAQAEEKKAMPGVTATEIKVGCTGPKSGPAAHFMTIFNSLEAYLNSINDKGGVNGRKIIFNLRDDGYNPVKTLEQTKSLVENEGVSFIFASLGSQTNLAARPYLNDNKIPQIFLFVGSPVFNDPKNFPWSSGGFLSYDIEAAAYAQHILKNVPDAKIAVLFQNDDYGLVFIEEFKKALGEQADKMIVAQESYELTDPTVKKQMLKLKASGANVLFTIALPKQSTQALQELVGSDWKPLRIMSSQGALREVAFKAVGYENAKGIITAAVFKDVLNPKWQNDPGVVEFKSFVTSNLGKDMDPGSTMALFGFNAGHILEQIIKLCGDDLSREHIMKVASNFSYAAPLLMPGIEYNSTPDDVRPFKSLYLVQFDGESWGPMGEKFTIPNAQAEKTPPAEKK